MYLLDFVFLFCYYNFGLSGLVNSVRNKISAPKLFMAFGCPSLKSNNY